MRPKIALKFICFTYLVDGIEIKVEFHPLKNQEFNFSVLVISAKYGWYEAEKEMFANTAIAWRAVRRYIKQLNFKQTA